MSILSLHLSCFLLLVVLRCSLSFFHFISIGVVTGTMSAGVDTTSTVVWFLAQLLGLLLSWLSVLSPFLLSGWITLSFPIKELSSSLLLKGLNLFEASMKNSPSSHQTNQSSMDKSLRQFHGRYLHSVP